ncbi:MAG TPA: M56 family metallopeptidase [Mucilaginibacter sp.]|jgi:beta-lactamase regulating signal transducer with metallopeptidase domain|nr:M56 family metallopeptidase [Mucilaginibacter sp.]
METSFWAPYIPDGTVRAICWTLIHSLWIGLVIALLCGMTIAATRKSAAVIRYRLLCGLLVLFVFSVALTFGFELRSNNVPPLPPPPPVIIIAAPHTSAPQQVAMVLDRGIVDRAKEFLNQNMNIIFLVWLLFFMLKSLKMVSGLLYIQRIRHYKTSDVPEELKRRIEHLSSQIGIRRVVRLVQSELVKVPVAVGWLKPMILLPVGIVFQLTPEQLDGILWHELAHIHRRDYLVNILQGIVETVFFFNPGLLWLSSLIRTEREACCDDMVLSRMNRKANYLEALLSFGYGEFSQARYAMSIGSGNQLRDRLKRIISQENKRLSVAEKSVLAIGLVLLTAFTTVSKDNPIIRHLTIKYKNQSGKVITKKMTEITTVSMEALPAGQQLKDSKPATYRKDTILTDTAIRFTSVLFKNSDADPANNDINAMDNKGNKYHFVLKGNKIIAMEINDVKVDDSKLSSYDYMVAVIDRELAEKKRVREGLMAKLKASEPTARLEMIKLQLLKDSLKAMRLPASTKYSSDAEPGPKMMKAMKIQKRMHDDSLGYAAELKRMQDIIADLVRDKVVANAADVKWFGLSNTEFIVNGQKQPDEMQQRYKAKYGVHQDYGLYYGPVQMYGKGVFIDFSNPPPPPPPPPGRPAKPAKPGPKYMGAVMPNSRDSIVWKQQQLIKQQAHFAAYQDEKRAQLIQQQQAFAAEQNEKRAQILQQQQALLAGQSEKARQLWLKYDIDLQPAISGVIADLVSANVVSDKSQLSSFSLTNKALIVNGKKQAEDIHETLKSKYLERSAYPGNFDGMDWNRIKDDPNFGLLFDTNGGQGLGIIGKRYSQ